MRTVALLLVLLGAALCLAPAASAAPRVDVGWPRASGAVLAPGQVLTLRVRTVRWTRGPRPLADVALLALTRSGKVRAVLARDRARARAFRVTVPRRVTGPVALRVRVAGRRLIRRYVIAPRPARTPAAPPVEGTPPGSAPAPAPGGAPPACDAPAGSAIATAGSPAAARAGQTVGLLVANQGATCLSGGICPTLEAQAFDGSWVEAVDDERGCPAVAEVLAPGAVRRYDFVLPPETPPGSLYRLALSLAGPEVTLEATTPIEVLP